jgi:SOS response regulatory protein OraA/RecX
MTEKLACQSIELDLIKWTLKYLQVRHLLQDQDQAESMMNLRS